MEFINLLAESDTFCNGESIKIFKFIGTIITTIKIIIPIILVIMGSIDLAKAVMAQKDDEIKKGYQSLMKRVIVAVIIFFLPSLVSMIIGLVGDESGEGTNTKCWRCATGSGCSGFESNSGNNSQSSGIPNNNNYAEEDLIEINSNIIVGQRLYVSGTEYEVKEGDTITSIAQNNNITVEKLISDNNLDEIGKLCPKDKMSSEENCDIMKCEENPTCQKIGTEWYCCLPN